MSNPAQGIVTQTTQVQVEAPTSQLVLPYRYVGLLTKDSATPSVKNVERWMANGTVTITNFADGQDGQEIKVLGNGTTTVANNANIKTNTGANKALGTNKVYTFTKFNGVWIEDA